SWLPTDGPDGPNDIVFRVHYNGMFFFDPLGYDQGRVVEMDGCSKDRVMYTHLLNMLAAKKLENVLFHFLDGLQGGKKDCFIDSKGPTSGSRAFWFIKSLKKGYIKAQRFLKSRSILNGSSLEVTHRTSCNIGVASLNIAPLYLEVEKFYQLEKEIHVISLGIEPQFENIISNGPFIPMATGQRKPEGQWTADERKAANLDQRLKSLIMSVLPDDQMNSVINCLTAKSTWDDLILYHEGPSDVKESRVMDLKLYYNTFKFKEGRTKEVAKFSAKLLHSSEHKPEPRRTKYFEAKYNKVKAKLALLNSSASAPSSSLDKNKGLFAETYDWDEEEVSSDDNEVTEVKALMALTDEERVSVGKESANNVEWVKISIKKSSETEDFTLYTGEIPSNESQRNTTDPSVVVSDSSATDYDSADESSVCSTPLLSVKKLDSVEPVSGPKNNKSILKSKSTFKAKTLKAPAGKLKNVKMEDDPPLAIVMKELNDLQITYLQEKGLLNSINKMLNWFLHNALQKQHNNTQFKMNYEICGQNTHLSKNCYEVLFCKKCKRTNHRTCDHAEFMSSMNANQHHIGQGESSSRSRHLRPSVSFPSCINCGYNDHHSNDCLYYPTCKIYGSYDHDTHGHNKIISLRRGINLRNHQHVTRNYETCGSNVHTTSDHNGIEWFRKRNSSS
ncbi:hypothetical protein Tco_0630581, partial [Tanacetum coccineum]